MGPSMETQRAQKIALNNIQVAKEFDCVRQNKPKQDTKGHRKQKRVDNCRYCRTGNLLRQCLHIQKTQRMQNAQSLQGGVKIGMGAVDGL